MGSTRHREGTANCSQSTQAESHQVAEVPSGFLTRVTCSSSVCARPCLPGQSHRCVVARLEVLIRLALFIPPPLPPFPV